MEKIEAERIRYTENNVIDVQVRDMWKFEEVETCESSSGRVVGPSFEITMINNESELGVQDISELNAVPPPGEGDLEGCTISHQDQINNAENGSVSQGVFQCIMCPEGFDKKLLLNNHMKKKHGINLVFTERGRKAKLVRLPEEDTPKGKGHASTSKDVEQRVCEVLENKSDEDEEGSGQWLGCGYAVKVDTPAYHMAIERNEIPFAAFFPINSKTGYLLRVQEYEPKNNLLNPASRNDVVRAFQYHRQISSSHTAGDLLPIVAFVHQYYNHTTRSTDINICSPENIPDLELKYISQDNFTTIAFGNSVSSCDPSDDEEMDEDPLPPPTPKPKRRGRRTKKEIEEAKMNAIKAAQPLLATSSNAHVEKNDNLQTENAEVSNLGDDEGREVPPTAAVNDNADNRPKLIPEVVQPSLDVVETHNPPEMPLVESDPLPPVLTQMKVNVERTDEESMHLDESVLPVTPSKATTPKSRKGDGKTGKGQKPRSTSKSTGLSSPKKPNSSLHVKITNVQDEPMDLSKRSNTHNDLEVENGTDTTQKRPPPAGYATNTALPTKRGLPRRLIFD
ncbi:uncharacterized protein LOC118437901 [Folsomia candida]|uniref:C2H2-type domain-containing protein n=1 Tax=Folsomia candida TaxID=158441 RepID=A0A226DKU1_FOLCA|nr:uncharacterized protein LOC118437901 [Folsomia candida]XP_035713307.1 uncharacterized protein LOC118437901 [Folsomia candida]OXA45843.1 hypothetical protein Fcan01_19740 [Folsomia candida]